MWALLILMLERLGIIVTVAFVVTRFGFMRKLLERRQVTLRQQLLVIILFGVFGIIGTFTGFIITEDGISTDRWARALGEEEAIANSRVIGVVAAGLLGGMKVGIGTGLIAGLHRFSLGGFTAFACGFAAVIAGLIAGWIHRKLHGRLVSVPGALWIGMLAEAIQMILILILSRPWSMSYELVERIGLPMILANGIGSALFILIIRNVISEEEKSGAVQAQKALRIAGVTLEHLSKGLTPTTAQSACEILIHEANAKAVAITDRQHILAHIGLGSDHHRSMVSIRTEATQKVLDSGELLVASNPLIGCSDASCPLRAVIISPLKKSDETIGTLKFYFSSEKEIRNVDLELIKGLSTLFGQQLELAEIQHFRQLANAAEIKALQTQIQPHFLFNAMNTIVYMIRVDPAKARALLISLSRYFRQNLSGTIHSAIFLRKELEHVKAYLQIEEARFNDTLQVNYQIDDRLLDVKLPSLTLQPLVENAIKHGLRNLEQGGTLTISVEPSDRGVLIKVTDNGIGMEKDILENLLTSVSSVTEESTGVGLYNVNRRLVMTLGEEAGIKIISESRRGTVISFIIPDQERREI
ncbi:LytS/YhcK type 5TM receptor domain-containing protein [Cohnella sp.]|uniref:LytS/YhcK type 5TM receptor domain-containing protein n=1 Tax=Cohnella sp. TaxID=1883426 RepID=UPI003567A07B